MSLETRIKLEMRGRKPQEVRQLNLDQSRATVLSGLSSDFENLEFLSLINVGLTSLKNFPTLPNLRKLELSDNRIASGLNLLNGSPKLQYLNVSGNKIKDLSTLEPLKEFPQLKALDLFNCEIAEECGSDYRNKVFALLTQLVYLDGLDKDDTEMPDEEDIDGEEESDDESDVEDDDDDDDDDDEDDDLEDEDEGEDEDDEENEVGLAYLQKENIEEDSDGEDFAPKEGEGEDDDDDIDEEDDDEGPAPTKGGESSSTAATAEEEDAAEPQQKRQKVSEEEPEPK